MIGFASIFLQTLCFAETPPIARLEEQIAAAFEISDCAEIYSLTLKIKGSQLSPLGEAVMGYCNLSPFKGDQQLEEASTRDLGDELIAFLFAKRIWRRDPELSLVYWRRALLVARTASLRVIIQNYIDGTANGDEEFRGNDTSLEASALVSGNDDDNPALYPLSENPNQSSFGIETQDELHYAKKTAYGFWGIDTVAKTLTFVENHDVDTQAIDLEVPFSFHIGRSENLSFVPLGGYTREGKTNLQSYYGLSVRAISYQGNFRHTVQGTIYEDNLYPAYVSSQSGTHLSFDYGWEWVTSTWSFRANPFVDHVTADADLDETDSGTFQIPYSYTAFGSSLDIEHNIGKVEIELYARLNLRFDQLESSYPGLVANQIIVKERADQNLDAKLSVTVPLNRGLQIIGWYEWIRTWSNMGPSDYEDRNSIDQIAALGLKFLYSSY